MNIYYDIEDNCYRTYPDGDIATTNQMTELIENKNLSIAKLQQENKQLTGKYLGAVVGYETTMSENKQLKDNWNKLKEYIKETKLKEVEKEFGTRYAKTFTQAEIIVCNMITSKMRELEGSDSNE